MIVSRIAAVFVMLATLTGAASAQQGGAQQNAVRETVKVKHGDWEVRCGEGDNCYMNQVVSNEEGAPLINVAIRQLKNNPQAKAIAVFVAPLGVVLPRGVEMRIDGGEPIGSPFLYCLANGCFSELAMTDEGLDRLRRGAAATLQIFSLQKPKDPIQRKLSLSGFTKAYGAL